MSAWITVPEALIAAWLGRRGLSGWADTLHERLLVPWRRHALPVSGDEPAALVDRFRAVRAPRSALAVALIEGDRTQALYRGRVRGRAADATTAFEIGSLSKTFTAALLGDMAARDEVTLETPVSELLPAHWRPRREQPRPLTLTDLACHTGGLPRLPGTSRMWAGRLLRPGNPYAWLATDEALRWPRQRRLQAIGAAYRYSNLGFGLLGALLARRLQTELATAWHTRLLQPLGLHATGVAASRSRGTLAQPHTAAGWPTPVWSMPGLAGAGALASTPADLVRWVRAHLHGTAPIHAEALQPRHRIDASRGMALGWHLIHGVDGGDIAWHNGATGGSRSFVAMQTARRRAVIVLINRAVSVDALGMQLLRSLAGA
jgi:serine-type D-Ala-D-Ala carboxypeptidase/endopeptidase